MRMKLPVRLVVGTLAALAIVVGYGSPASAQCYPNCVAGITIDDDTATPGQTLTATAFGLDAGTSASAVVNSAPISLGSKTVAANGTVSFSFVVPADFTGAHSVTITGTSNGRRVDLTARFTVTAAGVVTVPPTVRPGGPLARTGTDSALPLARIGVALLALGGLAGYFTSRRRLAPPT